MPISWEAECLSRNVSRFTEVYYHVHNSPQLCMFTPSYLTQDVSKILNNLLSMLPYGHIYYILEKPHSTIYASLLRSCTKTCSSVLLWTDIFYYSSCFELFIDIWSSWLWPMKDWNMFQMQCVNCKTAHWYFALNWLQ
jgi:hypothetical protein